MTRGRADGDGAAAPGACGGRRMAGVRVAIGRRRGFARAIASVSLAALLALAGCGVAGGRGGQASEPSSQDVAAQGGPSVSEGASSSAVAQSEEGTEEQDGGGSASGAEASSSASDTATSDTASAARRLAAPTTWDEAESPNYVRLVGSAVIEEELAPGESRYEGLDGLGRTGQVRACITHETMEAGKARERGSLPDPSGWPEENCEVDVALPTGRTYHGWFWNRSHLLAKSLGGTDERENLVTGTRMQNVGANDGQGGMDVFETAIRDWLDAYPDVTVQYVATPLYVGDELIPRSVVVDVRSSDGAIDEELEVYNACKGYAIDYFDGSFEAL